MINDDQDECDADRDADYSEEQRTKGDNMETGNGEVNAMVG